MTARRQAWRSGRRPWAALALGYLLVLQALLSGWTVAGHATVAGSGSIAAVLCTPDGIRPAADPGQRTDGRHDASCCLSGCGATGPGDAPPPSTAVSVIAAASRAPVPLPVDRTGTGQRHAPVGPRAPPPVA